MCFDLFLSLRINDNIYKYSLGYTIVSNERRITHQQQRKKKYRQQERNDERYSSRGTIILFVNMVQKTNKIILLRKCSISSNQNDCPGPLSPDIRYYETDVLDTVKRNTQKYTE